MDNDNQVGREVSRVKDLFLTETFGSQIQPPRVYSVEDEFGKTRSNRNPVVTITILAFVVVFVGVAAAVTLLIQRSSQRVEFDISDFQDVNLTEILDVQKRNENALETALRELADLERERASQIQAVNDDIDGRIELVSNENLSVTDRTDRTANLRDEGANRVAAIGREFDPLIEAKREEIDTIQSRIDEYDSRILEEAKRTEERLDNQQQLFELQTQEMRDYYEETIANLEENLEEQRIDLTRQKDELAALLRRNHAAELARQFSLYNPTFEERRVSSLLNRNLRAPDVTMAMLPGYSNTLASENVLNQRAFTQLRSSLEEFEMLLSRLELVPYENSIPEAFSKLRELETIIVSRYEYLWTTLASRVNDKNSEIAENEQTIEDQTTLIGRYAYAVEYLARDSRENGYILDARNTKDMLVHINPTLPVAAGSTGYVFRDVDDYIGEIRIYQDRAELVRLADANRPILPFDLFLIQLQ